MERKTESKSYIPKEERSEKVMRFLLDKSPIGLAFGVGPDIWAEIGRVATLTCGGIVVAAGAAALYYRNRESFQESFIDIPTGFVGVVVENKKVLHKDISAGKWNYQGPLSSYKEIKFVDIRPFEVFAPGRARAWIPSDVGRLGIEGDISIRLQVAKGWEIIEYINPDQPEINFQTEHPEAKFERSFKELVSRMADAELTAAAEEMSFGVLLNASEQADKLLSQDKVVLPSKIIRQLQDQTKRLVQEKLDAYTFSIRAPKKLKRIQKAIERGIPRESMKHGITAIHVSVADFRFTAEAKAALERSATSSIRTAGYKKMQDILGDEFTLKDLDAQIAQSVGKAGGVVVMHMGNGYARGGNGRSGSGSGGDTSESAALGLLAQIKREQEAGQKKSTRQKLFEAEQKLGVTGDEESEADDEFDEDDE